MEGFLLFDLCCSLCFGEVVRRRLTSCIDTAVVSVLLNVVLLLHFESWTNGIQRIFFALNEVVLFIFGKKKTIQWGQFLLPKKNAKVCVKQTFFFLSPLGFIFPMLLFAFSSSPFCFLFSFAFPFCSHNNTKTKTGRDFLMDLMRISENCWFQNKDAFRLEQCWNGKGEEFASL